MSVCQGQADKIFTVADRAAERQYQGDLSAYEAKLQRVKFDQVTLDM